MATPYFQLRFDTVTSTQDEARRRLGELPVAVSATNQTEGRGRSGAGWMNADRSVAVSLAARIDEDDRRPLSLMAGVAAARVAAGTRLKWPNDVMLDGVKVGGVLVERSGGVVVIGLGLDLWWEHPPDGMGSLLKSDPGSDGPTRMASAWTAEMMRLVDGENWPMSEYRKMSETIGRSITWEPDGAGKAIDVAADGGLVVVIDGTEDTLYSGAVRHVSG